MNESLDETEGAPDTPRPVEGGSEAAEEQASPWKPGPAHVYEYPDAEALADAAAERFLDSANRAVEKNDRFIVVLAGGSTPRGLYRRLTEPPYRESVPWSKTFFAFSDERCVAPDDETSNYRMARETLFDPLEIPAQQILRMKGEQEPAEAARRYQVRLGDLFLNHPRRHFDLVLLGIGADGHTASLFPGTAALAETERWVSANRVPGIGAWRLTLTLAALNKTRRVIFLATGEEKARVIAEAFGGVEHAEPHPCERVVPMHARREVLLDGAAASMMRSGVHADGTEGAG